MTARRPVDVTARDIKRAALDVEYYTLIHQGLGGAARKAFEAAVDAEYAKLPQPAPRAA